MNVSWWYTVVRCVDYVGLLGVPVTGGDPPDVEDIPDTGSSSNSSRVADIPLAQLRNA